MASDYGRVPRGVTMMKRLRITSKYHVELGRFIHGCLKKALQQYFRYIRRESKSKTICTCRLFFFTKGGKLNGIGVIARSTVDSMVVICLLP